MDSNKLRVTVRHAPGGDQNDLLDGILEASDFWEQLEQARRLQKARRANFKIAIKPDLDVFNPVIPSGTDPQLVNHLAAQLYKRGFVAIQVIDSRNCSDHWLLNREPLMVADLVGYDFTEKHYAVVGGEDTPEPAVAWSEAQFRINFAKNRTHESQTYALCIHNLLGVSSPEVVHNEAGGRCLNTLRQSPPHFNLVDAFISCHGAAGERSPKMLKTCTMLASSDALLIDIAGASKMGLDPFASKVNATCLHAVGLPTNYLIDGDLSPYPLWQNVHPMLADSARRRNEATGLGSVAAAWFQTVDRENFPFREYYSDRINSFITPMLSRIGEDPRAQWIAVMLNYTISNIGKAILAQHTLFAKGKLQRQIKSLETDLDKFCAADYTGLPEYLRSFEQLTQNAPRIAENMRLHRLDDATLFFGTFDCPIKYDDFVSSVKIEHSIQYMNDYIGGSWVTVATDQQGRVNMQAERNLYLPQPNWMILVGGDAIDVEKIELIDYQDNAQSIYWRTIGSPNQSAECDDGRVSFIRTDNDCVRIEIFTRQKFALPLAFQVAHIDLFPGIREPIIERGYQRFFTRTVANMQAEMEGRPYRVGQEPPSLGDLTGSGLSDLGRYLATALATLSELLRHKGDFVGMGEWFTARSWTAASSPTVAPLLAPDADGFQHFGPTPAGTRYDRAGREVSDYFKQLENVVMDSPGFMAGLATAVQRDFEAFAEKTSVEKSP